MSLAIIAPVVVKFERCDAMGVPRSNLLGKLEGLLHVVELISACFVFSLSFWGVMTVLSNTNVLFLFLLVNLTKFLEESGVDAFVDPRVGSTNGFFIELDNMMVPERSFEYVTGSVLLIVSMVWKL
jgi:hypothetical protein